MLRLYTYDKSCEYEDFPNHLFSSTAYHIEFDFEKDMLAIDKKSFRISSIMQMQGNCSECNRHELNLDINIKTGLKQFIQNLFNC